MVVSEPELPPPTTAAEVQRDSGGSVSGQQTGHGTSLSNTTLRVRSRSRTRESRDTTMVLSQRETQHSQRDVGFRRFKI